MYTSKIKNKEFVDGQIVITVEFTDGVTTVTETCKPQNKDGFVVWLRSRLDAFNSAKTIDTDYAVDETVDPTPVEPEPTPPTQAELDEQQWFKDHARLLRVKTQLVDLGVIAADNAKYLALQDKVRNNLKAAYIDKF